MENIRQYILSVIIAAMICGISVTVVPSKTGKAWIRLLCGLILTITVIKPLSGVIHLDISLFDPEKWVEGESITAQAEKQARDSMSVIIKERCEAYILDKANELGVSITADVLLSQDAIPVPVSVTLSGSVSPYLRLKLESIIQEDMGITKENLRWKE